MIKNLSIQLENSSDFEIAAISPFLVDLFEKNQILFLLIN
jgi:hypothetical protein